MTEDEAKPQDRRIDLESLKALAHPLRVRILDVLSTYGAQTASSLAERLGESSGATSYHLRQLERHAFVREVADRGTGRERWWERPPGGLELTVADLPPTPAARMAQDLVVREWQRHRDALLNDFLEHGDERLPKRWLDATAVNTSNARLTAEQLGELVAELNEVLDRHTAKHRHQKDAPIPGSRPVQIHLNAFPVLDAEETPGADDENHDISGRRGS